MRKKYSPVYPVAVRVAAAFYALKRHLFMPRAATGGGWNLKWFCITKA
jgi:hypothetical protein